MAALVGCMITDPWTGKCMDGQQGGNVGADAANAVLSGSLSLPGVDWLKAASPILSGAFSPSPAGPSQASLWQNQTFDNSGWTVSTGGSSASGAQTGLQLPQWGAVAVAVVAVLAWAKTKKA